MKFITPEIIAKTSKGDATYGGGAKYLPPAELIPRGIESTPFYMLASDLLNKGFASPSVPNMLLVPEFECVEETIPLFIRSILTSGPDDYHYKLKGTALILSEMFQPEPC